MTYYSIKCFFAITIWTFYLLTFIIFISMGFIRNKNYTLEFPDGRVTYLTATGSEDKKDDYASSLTEMAHVKDELLLLSWIKNHNKDEE